MLERGGHSHSAAAGRNRWGPLGDTEGAAAPPHCTCFGYAGPVEGAWGPTAVDAPGLRAPVPSRFCPLAASRLWVGLPEPCVD